MKTLSEQMEWERDQRHAKVTSSSTSGPSKFFTSETSKRKRDTDEDIICTPRHRQKPRTSRKQRNDKENEPPLIDPVMQEVGYQSPGEQLLLDVSSPIERLSLNDEGPIHEDISSPAEFPPVAHLPPRPCAHRTYSGVAEPLSPTKAKHASPQILVPGTPVLNQPLVSEFGVNLWEELHVIDEEGDSEQDGDKTLVDSDFLPTPRELSCQNAKGKTAHSEEEFAQELNMLGDLAADETAKKVMMGWRTQYSHSIKPYPSSASQVGPLISFHL